MRDARTHTQLPADQEDQLHTTHGDETYDTHRQDTGTGTSTPCIQCSTYGCQLGCLWSLVVVSSVPRVVFCAGVIVFVCVLYVV